MKCKAWPKGAKSAKWLESDKACVACVVEDLTNEEPANNQPPADNPNTQHDELIKMIKGQSKLLYQFSLMLTLSTLSPAWKQAVIDHLLADLETKCLADEAKKNRLEEKKLNIERMKACIVASNCQGQASLVV
jgi:hypothetical protein